MKQDKTFVEIIQYPDTGKTAEITGNWFWTRNGTGGFVNLNGFGEVNTAGGIGAPSNTALEAQRHWGKIELCTYSVTLERDLCFIGG